MSLHRRSFDHAHKYLGCQILHIFHGISKFISIYDAHGDNKFGEGLKPIILIGI